MCAVALGPPTMVTTPVGMVVVVTDTAHSYQTVAVNFRLLGRRLDHPAPGSLQF